jgi:hypothetical protein
MESDVHIILVCHGGLSAVEGDVRFAGIEDIEQEEIVGYGVGGL